MRNALFCEPPSSGVLLETNELELRAEFPLSSSSQNLNLIRFFFSSIKDLIITNPWLGPYYCAQKKKSRITVQQGSSAVKLVSAVSTGLASSISSSAGIQKMSRAAVNEPLLHI